VPPFTSELLMEHHDISAFRSGHDSLDEWLRQRARSVALRGTGRTFIWHRGDDKVVAYYTLAAHLVARKGLPSRIGRGGPQEIPAVLLAKLVLDISWQGQGLGGELLVDAFSRVVRATQTVAARVVVVDAIDETAVRFYEHHGFRRVPESARLVQKISDIAAALDAR